MAERSTLLITVQRGLGGLRACAVCECEVHSRWFAATTLRLLALLTAEA